MARQSPKYYKNNRGYVYGTAIVPYEPHFGKLWDDCKRITNWIYDYDIRTQYTKVPQDIIGDIDFHTLNAMLFALAKRGRPERRIDDYFVRFFGKRLAIVKRPHGYVAINTLLAISLPCFDVDKIEHFDSIRWVDIYQDRLEYHYATIPRQPFNINAIPNLMITADDDDDNGE
jgi:hypothetical protein